MDENQFSWRSMIQQQNWQEDMINKYETPAAQVRMYKEAGLNPYQIGEQGVNVNTPSSPGGMSSASVNSGPDIMGVLSSIVGIALQKEQNDIARTNAEANYIKADSESYKNYVDAGLSDVNRQIQEINLKYADIEKQLSVYKTREEINNIIEDTKLKGTQIEVNGQQIDLMVSQEWLNQSNYDLNVQKILESKANVEKILSSANLDRWNAKKIEEMLPYEKAFTAAQTELANAKTETEKADAKLKLAQASKTYVDEMYQRRMMASGYIESLARKTENESMTEASRREYLNAKTDFTEAATTGQQIDNIVAGATIASKILKSYTVDLFTPSRSSSTEIIKNPDGSIIKKGSSSLNYNYPDMPDPLSKVPGKFRKK